MFQELTPKIYPQPTVFEDPVGSLMGGALGMVNLAHSAGEVYKIGKSVALDNEVGKIVGDTDTKIADLAKTKPVEPTQTPIPQQMSTPIPQAIKDEKIAAMMGTQSPAFPNQAPVEGASLANSVQQTAVAGNNDTAQADYAKQTEAFNHKRMEINADMNDKIIQAHMKHGFVAEAESLKQKFMTNVEKMAVLSPSTAQRIWNNSYLKGQFGEIDLADAGKEWTPTQDGNRIVNKKTGAFRDLPANPAALMKELQKPYSVAEGGKRSMNFIDPKDGKIKEIVLSVNPKTDKEARPEVREFQVGDRKEYRQWNKDTKKWDTVPDTGGPNWKPDDEKYLANVKLGKDLWDKGFLAEYGTYDPSSKAANGKPVDAVEPAKSVEEALMRNPQAKASYNFGIQQLSKHIKAGMDPVAAENQARIDAKNRSVRIKTGMSELQADEVLAESITGALAARNTKTGKFRLLYDPSAQPIAMTAEQKPKGTPTAASGPSSPKQSLPTKNTPPDAALDARIREAKNISPGAWARMTSLEKETIRAQFREDRKARKPQIQTKAPEGIFNPSADNEGKTYYNPRIGFVRQ